MGGCIIVYSIYLHLHTGDILCAHLAHCYPTQLMGSLLKLGKNFLTFDFTEKYKNHLPIGELAAKYRETGIFSGRSRTFCATRHRYVLVQCFISGFEVYGVKIGWEGRLSANF